MTNFTEDDLLRVLAWFNEESEITPPRLFSFYCDKDHDKNAKALYALGKLVDLGYIDVVKAPADNILSWKKNDMTDTYVTDIKNAKEIADIELETKRLTLHKLRNDAPKSETDRKHAIFLYRYRYIVVLTVFILLATFVCNRIDKQDSQEKKKPEPHIEEASIFSGLHPIRSTIPAITPTDIFHIYNGR